MSEASWSITDARVIDGTGGILDGASIEIVDDRIAAVHQGGWRTPAGTRVVGAGGRTVMPGLIDAHVHLSGYDHLPPIRRGEPPHPPELRYFELAAAARSFLDAGVTTVRDVGSMDGHALVLRAAVALGLTPGPRILTCARIVSATAPGGVIFTTMYRQADGPDEMRKAVREQVRDGADFVKVMATGARSVVREDPEPAQVTRDELRAIVEESHRLGKRVAAHAEGLGGARLAVEEGVDTIEHGLSLHREPALLDRMAEQGTVLVPTLSTFHDLATTKSELYPAVLVEQARRQLEEANLTLLAARAAGVTIAMGFDSHPPGAEALELVRMVDAGLEPMEAITAATSGSARACGLDDVGVIRAGAIADLIVVDGDPTADVGILGREAGRWLIVHDGIPTGGTGLRDLA